MNDRRIHTGRTNKHVLITTAAVLLTLPLVVFVVQQQQELRQRASTVKFATLPPGSLLPSDEECTNRVRNASWEPRPENRPANLRNAYEDGYRLNGSQLAQYGAEYERKVTGNFTGTTDEIVQWAACKWGFDEDTVRAQAAVESSWHQSLLGDCRGGQVQPETNSCHSVGMMQIKAANIPPTHPGTWPYARLSTAFNIDYTLAMRRACFDGKVTSLGQGYTAGDEWGCIGSWETGDWHSQNAEKYISKVKTSLASKDWNSYGAGPAPTVPIYSGTNPFLWLAQVDEQTDTPTPTIYGGPSATPTPDPYISPTAIPTIDPYISPTAIPTTAPYALSPTPTLYAKPSPTPTLYVRLSPTPTINPYAKPSPTPTVNPYAKPSPTPTVNPYGNPSPTPTVNPYNNPTATPATNPYGGPPASAAPTSPYMTPAFYCLAAPCPITPSVEPTLTGEPYEGPTVTEGAEAPVIITAAPTEDPCSTASSLAHDRKKKKSKHKNSDKEGGVSKFMDGFLKFILELLTLLLQILGNPPAPAPAPEQPQPTDSEDPDVGEPDPCEPFPVEPTSPGEPAPTEVESPQPSNSEPTAPQGPVVSPSTVITAPVSPVVSANPSNALPSETVSPSAGVSIIVASPTEDPCAAISVADHRDDEERQSKHKQHDGLISQFMKFFLELFAVILKFIGLSPTQPTPTPTPPIPTVGPVATPTDELPIPTNAPEPTQPASVPTDAPTAQPQPTSTPEPTNVTDPTNAAEPTVDPCLTPSAPTETVTPVVTAIPSVTVAPTTPFTLQRDR